MKQTGILCSYRFPKPVFIGIDLAWQANNASGLAVIADTRLAAWRGDAGSDEELLALVGAWMTPGASAVVAIDAPLRVPNRAGARACDRALSAEWHRYEAGALPANRRLLDRGEGVRGERLVAALVERHGYVESTAVEARPAARYVCEVFPHPAHVSLFGLDRTLKYKAKPGRSLDARWAEFERYRGLLAGLATADPPLEGLEPILAEPIAGMRGKALKAFEDTLDAITCAYVAAYLWRHGAAGAKVYGTEGEGAIVVPLQVASGGRVASSATPR
jgi:predicted RNase H-like nuclease